MHYCFIIDGILQKVKFYNKESQLKVNLIFNLKIIYNKGVKQKYKSMKFQKF